MSLSVLGAAALGAGLNAVGGFAQSMFSQNAQRDAEDRSYQRSLALMREQNQWNLARWHEANAYNAPANQLKLMQDAGINPALWDMRGQSPASEVTSAEASVPYNSQAGNEFNAMDLNSLGNQVIQALQVDAQIAKLRTEIKRNDLLNRDLSNELEAKEEMLDNPESLVRDAEDVVSNDGKVVEVVNWRKRNAYQEKRMNDRYFAARNLLSSERESKELQGFLEDYPFLRSMTKQQLKSLSADIKSKNLNNQLLQEDVKMMKQYGISSNDKNEWTALLRAALHDPDNISRILDAMATATQRTGQHLIEGLFGKGASHRNPGSW